MSRKNWTDDKLIARLINNKTDKSRWVLENGKIRLHEEWKWTSGDHSEGKSIIEEL